MRDLYKSKSYRDVIRKAVGAPTELAKPKLTYKDIASCCKISQVYLSRILSGTGDLTEDHVFRIGRLLELSEDDMEYFLLLHQRDRSNERSRIDWLTTKIRNFQESRRHSSEHIQAITSEDSKGTYIEFFLDPYCQLIHVFLGIKKFSRQPDKLCELLNISLDFLSLKLKKLMEMDLVEAKDNLYVCKAHNLHLSPNSPMYTGYLALIRTLALERSTARRQKSNYNFSVLFAANDDVRQSLHDQFLALIKSAQSASEIAKQEHVYQLNFDLIGWG